jgi:hypothetical protein
MLKDMLPGMISEVNAINGWRYLKWNSLNMLVQNKLYFQNQN